MHAARAAALPSRLWLHTDLLPALKTAGHKSVLFVGTQSYLAGAHPRLFVFSQTADAVRPNNDDDALVFIPYHSPSSTNVVNYSVRESLKGPPHICIEGYNAALPQNCQALGVSRMAVFNEPITCALIATVGMRRGTFSYDADRRLNMPTFRISVTSKEGKST